MDLHNDSLLFTFNLNINQKKNMIFNLFKYYLYSLNFKCLNKRMEKNILTHLSKLSYFM